MNSVPILLYLLECFLPTVEVFSIKNYLTDMIS